MIMVGCDFHTRFQQVAMLDPTTGEVIERRLEHETGEARRFYASLCEPARVGIEATVNAQWFEKVLREYHHELWVGDAAEIRAMRVRKQKTDSRDALHILDLLLTDRFPRIWIQQGGTPRTGSVGAGSVGQPSPARTAATARSTQPLDCGSGPGRDAGSAKSSGSAALNEGARSGAGDGIGLCVDDRSGRPFPEKQASGELPGPESQ